MKKCLKCEKEHDGSYGSGRYCSRSCANSRVKSDEVKLKQSISSKNSEKVKLANRKRQKREIRICLNENCNKDFFAYPNSSKVFCSKKCKPVLPKRVVLKKHKKHKKQEIGFIDTRICLNENCKKEFSVKSYRMKKYCCSKCAYTSQNWLDNKSKGTKKNYLDGRKVYGGNTKWYEVETSKGTIKVQGSYEVRVCKILDNWEKEKKILNWEYTNDRIKYIGFDGLIHNYLLDFKIWNNKDSFYYIESKGYKRELDDLKWRETEKQGYELKVWYEKDIKEYEKTIIN